MSSKDLFGYGLGHDYGPAGRSEEVDVSNLGERDQR
jgi:hypothetical protein